MVGNIKSTVQLYKSKQGYNFQNRLGYDCVAEGSIINLSDGTSIPIEYFNIHDILVETYDESKKGLVFNNKSYMAYKEARECIELLFNDGMHIRCTPDHEILTTEGYIKADEITNEMKVITSSPNPVPLGYYHTISTWACKLKNLILTCENDFNKRKSMAFFRTYGYYLSYNHFGKPNDKLSFETIFDVNQYIDDVCKLVGNYRNYEKERSTYYYNIPHSLFDDFMYIGNDSIHGIPNSIISPHCPLYLKQEFLAGLYGGLYREEVRLKYKEGNYTFSDIVFKIPEVMYVNFHTIIIKLLSELGINITKYDFITKTINIHNIDAIKFFDIIGYRYSIYKKIGASLLYKYRKAKLVDNKLELKDWVKKMELSNYINGKYRITDTIPSFFSYLHTKRNIGLVEVYDITVDITHNFISNGIVVHNCHGLPIEMVANKELSINTRKDVLDFGVENYNQYCKDMITRYSGAWTPIYERIGRWADFTDTYKTMDTNFMESVWWTFKQMWDKNLVYKGYRVMPFSTKCSTALSNFEASQNYKQIDTKSIYVMFPVQDMENTFIVAWTTTPWTLPSNIALCVNPDTEYIIGKTKDNKNFIISKNCKNITLTEVQTFRKGKEMVGMKYKPVFNYFENITPRAHQIVADNYVLDDGTGTGIVHIAPAFGEDDYRVCIENDIITDIGRICPIDDDGNYTHIITDFYNIKVLEADELIINNLKEKKLIVKQQTYNHSYPFCYRTDTPLIYKAVSGFFIKVTELKDKLIENNDKVTWIPENIGSGRFKQWLSNVKDWNVSRNRFFGTPLPVWISEDEEEMICVGSIDELVEMTGIERPTDLHLENINKIMIPSKMGKGMLKPVGLVFDCWFESGAVPIAQLHYPFENKEILDSKEYLSDFIAEGLDQTRGWFYTLMVISTAIFNKPAFKTVMCTGLILDEKGVKFSKKYGNFKDPMELLNKYGADVMRLYLENSPTIKAEPLLFTEANIDKLKNRLGPWIQGTRFFIEHCTNYLLKGNEFNHNAYKTSPHIMDKWIVSLVGSLINKVHKCMDNYQLDTAIHYMINFIDDLANWYIKLNRDRIKGLEGSENARDSLSTLLHVLVSYTITISNFTPYISEYLYDHLKPILRETQESVHLLPLVNTKNGDFDINLEVEEKFRMIQNIANMIRQLRCKTTTHTSLKVPIKGITIYHGDKKCLDMIKDLEFVLSDEINFNILEFGYKLLKDDATYKVIPNNKALGQKYKGEASNIKKALENVNRQVLINFYEGITDNVCVYVNKGGLINEYPLTKDEITIEAEMIITDPTLLSISNDGFTVNVDITYNELVHNKGQVRKFTGFIQNFRKISGLHPWNPIVIKVNSSEYFKNLLAEYDEKIRNKIGCSYTYESDEKFKKVEYEYEYLDGKLELIELEILI